MALAAPSPVPRRMRKGTGATSSERTLAVPVDREERRSSLTIKLKTSAKDAALEDLAMDPARASTNAMVEWSANNKLPPAVVAAFHEKKLCLKALSIAQMAEIRTLLSDTIVDASLLDLVVTAISSLAGPDASKSAADSISKLTTSKTTTTTPCTTAASMWVGWPDLTKSEKSEIEEIVNKDLPRIEKEMKASFERVKKDINQYFDKAVIELDQRRKKLISDAEAGKVEKEEFIRSEQKRFEKRIEQLNKVIDDESLIFGDVSIGCVDKRDKVEFLRRDLAVEEVESKDESGAIKKVTRPFVKDILVNGQILLQTTNISDVIAGLGKIDNCFIPNTPVIVSVDLFTHNSVQIFWEQIDDEFDSEVTGFEVDYSRSVLLRDDNPDNDAYVEWKSIKVDRESAIDRADTSRYSLIIDGLKHGETYFARVRAINRYGSSLPSEMKSTPTADVSAPSKPTVTTSLVNKNDVMLKWSVKVELEEAITRNSTSMLVHALSYGPYEEEKDGEAKKELAEVTHIHIQYRKKGKKSWKSLVISAEEGDDHTIKHLSPSKSYQFRLRARNKVDWSEWSEILEVDIPSAGPEEIECTVVENRDKLSASYSPANLLIHNDSSYASPPPKDFEIDEADWIVFGTATYYSSLTRLVIEQYGDPSDVKELSIEICSDLFKEDWVTVQPSVISVRKISDRQIFELRPMRTNFKYIRVSFLSNHFRIKDEPLKKKFMVRQIKLFGVPA